MTQVATKLTHAPLNWASQEGAGTGTRTLLACFGFAIFLELAALTSVGWHEHWLAHPQKTTGLDESHFIETTIFQLPSNAHLVDSKKAPSVHKQEAAISTKVQDKKVATGNSAASEPENETESGPDPAATHGPIATYAPLPVLPSYLQEQELNAHVVIDFYVSALGAVTPKLVGSSGNDELDAIALEAAHKWKFRAAEDQHRAIDAKSRVRMIFEVK